MKDLLAFAEIINLLVSFEDNFNLIIAKQIFGEQAEFLFALFVNKNKNLLNFYISLQPENQYKLVSGIYDVYKLIVFDGGLK